MVKLRPIQTLQTDIVIKEEVVEDEVNFTHNELLLSMFNMGNAADQKQTSTCDPVVKQEEEDSYEQSQNQDNLSQGEISRALSLDLSSVDQAIKDGTPPPELKRVVLTHETPALFCNSKVTVTRGKPSVIGISSGSRSWQPAGSQPIGLRGARRVVHEPPPSLSVINPSLANALSSLKHTAEPPRGPRPYIPRTTLACSILSALNSPPKTVQSPVIAAKQPSPVNSSSPSPVPHQFTIRPARAPPLAEVSLSSWLRELAEAGPKSAYIPPTLGPLTIDAIGRPCRTAGPVTLETPVISTATTCTGETSGAASPVTSHIVSFNGEQREVPDEIRCHLCDFPMKICFRKSKYKSEIREYPAYRCLRKGCQTFRAIRKVIEPENYVNQPRKRKPSQDQEVLNSYHDRIIVAPLPEEPVGPMEKMIKEEPVSQMGTLVYVPISITADQIQKIQLAAMEIVSQGGGNDTSSTTPPSIVAPCPFSSAQLKDHLQTAEGTKIVQNILLRAHHEQASNSSCPAGVSSSLGISPPLSPHPTTSSTDVFPSFNDKQPILDNDYNFDDSSFP